MEVDVKERIRLILELNNSNPNQLAKKYSFIDISRVGIYGHSGGGFMAGAANFYLSGFL